MSIDALADVSTDASVGSDSLPLTNCIYLKFPKSLKRFSSSIMRDVVIAFRMTAKLFSFRKEVPNGWIIIRNVTTKLAYFLI